MNFKSKIKPNRNKQLIKKSFIFSKSLLELYIELVRNNEFELSDRILKVGLPIRENLERTIVAISKNDFYGNLFNAYTLAVETRYWIKMVQMDHIIHTSCDNCVEQLNEIILILNYMSQVDNSFKANLNIQNLN